LNLSNLLKTNTGSVDVEIGSEKSEGVKSNGRRSSAATVNSVIFGADENDLQSDSKSDGLSEKLRDDDSIKSFKSVRSSKSAGVVSEKSSRVSSADAEQTLSGTFSSKHRILSGHAAPLSALGVSNSGRIIVSAEVGHPVGKVRLTFSAYIEKFLKVY